MPSTRAGYTLVELIVIILLIAVGTTLVLSIHTTLQRKALDVNDEERIRTFQQEFTMYSMKYGGNFPSVQTYISEPDRATRFTDYRQRPAKALRILFQGNNRAENEMLPLLYSPLDGKIPDVLLTSMLKNSSLTDKETMCFSSYAYDPGHRMPIKKDLTVADPGDGATVIFGHSPSFLVRHGRNFTRVISANGQVHLLYLKSDRKAYEIEVRVGGAKPTVLLDDIYQDQVTSLYNRDSYLSDEIPLSP